MIDTLFGNSFHLSNGRVIQLLPRKIICDADAFIQIPEKLKTLAPGKPLALVMDPRTRRAAGEKILSILNETQNAVHPIILGSDTTEEPRCDEQHLRYLQHQIDSQHFLIAIGSGVINDLCKWLASLREQPYICCATAASMNGYASANVAVTRGAVKELIHGRPPELIFAQPDILASAPANMTTAGVGDLLAKEVSTLDWLLNHYLFGDELVEESIAWSNRAAQLLFSHYHNLPQRTGAVAKLFYALLITGAAMTLAGTSSPASGAEHLFSHTLDMLAIRDHRHHDLHGRQVGIGTILTARLWQYILSLNPSKIRITPIPELDLHAFWGTLTPNIRKHYEAKRPRLVQAQKLLNPARWEAIRQKLIPYAPDTSRILRILKHVGGAWRFEHIGINEDLAAQVIIHAHQMRSRFTCLDLAYILGITPQELIQIVIPPNHT
ncbi:MAG: iron-containing alcohol dehydrogenase [Lentisphaerae bacterium]|nr:MAG: iron-containing alcohol dehydrogenase [Lentisphaerota bacterium]